MKKNLLFFLLILLFIFSACNGLKNENTPIPTEGMKKLSDDIFVMPEGFRAFDDDEIFAVIGDEETTGVIPLFMARSKDETDEEPTEMFMYYKSADAEDMDFDFIEMVMKAGAVDGENLERREISRNIAGQSFKGFSFCIEGKSYYEVITAKQDNISYVISYLTNIEKNPEYVDFMKKFYKE